MLASCCSGVKARAFATSMRRSPPPCTDPPALPLTPDPAPSPSSALRAWLATLSARYDGAVMRDAPPADPAVAADTDPADAAQTSDLDAALRAWCEHGSGDGRAPLWRPWALPDLPEPLRVARWAPGAGPPARVEALMRELDRNAELATLAARSRLASLRLRLAVKWRELRWWRPRHPQQPWDTGYLRGGAQAQAQLARFRPRRPTLMVAQGLPEAELAQVLAALQTAQAMYRHPVRVLLLDPPSPGQHALAASATPIGPE